MTAGAPNRKFSQQSVAFVLLLLVVDFEFSQGLAAQKRPASEPAGNFANKRTKGMEPFEHAGEQAGLEIWRIENFHPVKYPKSDYGKFYEGDSYIVLNTKISKNGMKSWDIHFWLGKDTSQDESGSAAIFSVQLDNNLGGDPVEHREVQEHESQKFLSYFKNGVRYLPGGVNTGFHHVDPNKFETRLFQVKGSRNIRVKQVSPDISSMNKGDCFILDAGRNIYVYVGLKSKRVEKLKAIGAANQIRDQDHAGKASVTIVDQYSPERDFTEFFEALGGGSADLVPEEGVGGDDAKFESDQEKIVTLYRVSDASGKLQITPIGQKPLEQSALDPNDCFILDSTDSNIFVWVGKKCTPKEKQESMRKAEDFLKSKNYPKWTHLQRIVQGAEPTAFTQYFKSWKSSSELRGRLVRAVSVDEHENWEPRLFHAQIRRPGAKFTIEEVMDFEQNDLNEDDIMLLDTGKEVFVWIGNGASEEEKNQSRTLAETYMKEHGHESASAVVVNQGEEPSNFKKRFESWNPDLWKDVPPYKEAI